MNWIALLTVLGGTGFVISCVALLGRLDPWNEDKPSKWPLPLLIVSTVVLALAAGMGVK